MSPVRVQRRRTKGWRTPPCSCGCGKPARYVGRGTPWGNPWRVGDVITVLAPVRRGSAFVRELVDLGQHYDDDAPIKLDWTEHYATNGQITTPSGVIVEGA